MLSDRHRALPIEWAARACLAMNNPSEALGWAEEAVLLDDAQDATALRNEAMEAMGIKDEGDRFRIPD